jgi:hypothetical protein
MSELRRAATMATARRSALRPISRKIQATPFWSLRQERGFGFSIIAISKRWYLWKTFDRVTLSAALDVEHRFSVAREP